jgi:hypothetical protein
MPANWGFVIAAYGLSAVVIFLYWRRLIRREHELERSTAERSRQPSVAGSASTVAERSREPSRAGHPRSEPGSRSPRQQ